VIVSGTPVERHGELYVKREDLSCPPPGPPFSKARGVYAHLKKRPERLIGVLDTFHSQAGHAVARACSLLGKDCVNFYPRTVRDGDQLREPQLRSAGLGARLEPLAAGRSSVLYHQAARSIRERGGYMMPNALKLGESVEETAKEVPAAPFDSVVIPVSSGTIAAGVIRGFAGIAVRRFFLHLGYSRPRGAVLEYVGRASGLIGLTAPSAELIVVDEGYAYRDVARPGPTPPWPCNVYYDLKAYRWWVASGPRDRTLFWNIG